MADQKLTALTAVSDLADTDLLYAVDGVGGTPASKKITGATLKTSVITAVDSTFATQDVVNDVAAARKPPTYTLIGGQQDETFIVSNCTQSADTTNFKLGAQGHKLTMSEAVTATAIADPPFGGEDPATFPPAAAVFGWFYVPEPAKVTSITIQVNSSLDPVTVWSRSITSFDTGWNLFHQKASAGTLTGWGTAVRAGVSIVTSAATDVTVGHVWLDCPPKAQVLFIADRGYKTFLDSGYPDLKALGVPVTFALDPDTLGTGSGTSEVMSEADVATVATDGNRNSIGFHGWDGAATSSATAAEIVADTLNAIRWLQSRGYGGGVWRAGWPQNDAANADAARPFVLAYATPSSGAAVESFPFMDRWNVARLSVHGRTEATVDGWFDTLEATHQVLVCYTHGISSGGGNDATQAEWDYFVSKVSAAVSSGWLEGVTFEDLVARGGVRFRQGLGDVSVELPGVDGSVSSVRLP